MGLADCQSGSFKVPSSFGALSTGVASALIRADSPFAGRASAFAPDARNNKRHRLRSPHAKLPWLREKLLMEPGFVVRHSRVSYIHNSAFARASALALLHAILALHNSIFTRVPVPSPARR